VSEHKPTRPYEGGHITCYQKHYVLPETKYYKFTLFLHVTWTFLGTLGTWYVIISAITRLIEKERPIHHSVQTAEYNNTKYTKHSKKYRVIPSVLDPRKCEYLKDYSLDFEYAYLTTYLASWEACRYYRRCWKCSPPLSRQSWKRRFMFALRYSHFLGSSTEGTTLYNNTVEPVLQDHHSNTVTYSVNNTTYIGNQY
jgi:hypothetical protein